MTLESQTEFGGVPVFLPEQNAVLVGRISDNESEMAGMEAYYVHWRGGVYIGNYNEADNAFTSEYSTEVSERTMSRQVKSFKEMDVDVELSDIGESLLDAYEFIETGAVSSGQGHVFSLQIVHNFTRNEVATILNSSPDTVDAQRRAAAKELENASDFLKLYNSKK